MDGLLVFILPSGNREAKEKEKNHRKKLEVPVGTSRMHDQFRIQEYQSSSDIASTI